MHAEVHIESEYLTLGDPEYICEYCGAIMWYEEGVKSRSSKNKVKFNMCWLEGKVLLPNLKDPLELLRTLLDYTKGITETTFRQPITMDTQSTEEWIMAGTNK